MPLNGSGTYIPPSSPGAFNPAVSGQNATPTSWNALLADISTAISTMLAADGQSTVTQNLPMANHKFTGLAAGTAATDSVNLSQLQSNTSNYAADSGAADAYVITLSPSIVAYTVGQTFKVKIANTNLTTTPTLKVDGLTAGTIVNPDGSAVPIGSIIAGEVMVVVVSAVSTGTPTFQLQNGVFLYKSANLSDVPSPSAARINLNTIAAVKVQKFAASGTYTPATGLIYCVIECVGGGGGGGGVNGAASNGAASGGGGGGGYSRLLATAATIGASKAVTIGAGGAGGTAGANNGTAGGDTSVGTLCIGKGGSGGVAASPAGSVFNGAGGAGGVAGTGDVALAGQPGTVGVNGQNAATGWPTGGAGGNTHFGGGAQGTSQTPAASASYAGTNAPTNTGGGGSGAMAYNSTSTKAGGAGSDGYVVITEFTNQ